VIKVKKSLKLWKYLKVLKKKLFSKEKKIKKIIIIIIRHIV
jgi:hypothetical protein